MRIRSMSLFVGSRAWDLLFNAAIVLVAPASFGQYATFDAGTDTVQIPAYSPLGGAATYEARILLVDPNEPQRIVWMEHQWACMDRQFQVRASEVFGYCHPPGGLTAVDASFSVGQWHHIAFCYDGGQQRIYIDGVLRATRSAGGGIGNCNYRASLGAFYRDTCGHGGCSVVYPGFIGVLDSIRISNIARYSGDSFAPPQGDLPSDDNAVLLYNFNDEPGSPTITDESPQARHGYPGSGFPGATAPAIGPSGFAPDLTVSGLSAPASAHFGDALTVNYNSQNIGNLVAGGAWTESVYLSSDPSLDASDTLVGSLEVSGPLAAGGSTPRLIAAALPENATASGTFHLLVRTDAANAIAESFESNNVGSVAIELAATGTPVVITAGASIGPSDRTYDDRNLIIRGCGVTIDGAHSFRSLRLERNEANQGASLTHSPGHSDAGVEGMYLTIDGDCFVQGPEGDLVGSVIDTSGRGHAPGTGPAPGANLGCNNGTGGGGHGGGGGTGPHGGGGGTYGSIEYPTGLGSGGGVACSPSAWGGGAIRLDVAGLMTVHGYIGASGAGAGGDGGFSVSGGGAGGSILIEAPSVNGTGTISADGGPGGFGRYRGGGGGGGRVAIHAEFFGFAGAITARGGDGYAVGGAGTVLLDDQGSNRLIIDNGAQPAGALTVIESLPVLTSLDITKSSARFVPPISVLGDVDIRTAYVELNGVCSVGGDLLISTESLFRHTPTVSGLHVIVENDVRIDTSSSINLDSIGFPPGSGPGHGANIGCNNRTGGGGHGGAGGSGAHGGGGGTYDSLEFPIEFGSGGGIACSPGAWGGGAARLQIAGTLVLDGTITAGGGGGGGGGANSSGGGAGGSILIEAGSIEGAGSISAAGGPGHASALGGGGGGGRIAVYYACANTLPSDRISTPGGPGSQAGGEGTVFIAEGGGNFSRPDLDVQQVVAAPYALPGQPAISFTISNSGTVAASGPWEDTVWLSTDTVLGSDVLIATIPRADSLGPGTSYTVNDLSIPPETTVGMYHVIVVSDSDDVVCESGDTANNIRVSGPISIGGPDLVPDMVSAPAAAVRGSTIQVGFVVRNTGQTSSPAWSTRILLSADPMPSPDDAVLAAALAGAPLCAGCEASMQLSGALPIGYQASNEFLIVQLDDAGAILELDEGNNSAIVPIELSPTPSVNLRAVSVSAPTAARFGETLSVSYFVTNTGTLPAVAPWLDLVYLSTDEQVGGDTLLASAARAVNVAAGASYTRTLQLLLPPNYSASGEHFILVRTDDAARVVESDESDNVVSATISLQPTLSADLVVESVSTPSETADGHPAQVSWVVRNTGGAGATAVWTDRVLLSADAALDGSDTLLGQFTRPQTLAAGGSYSRAESVPIAPGLHGPYYFIVHTDATGVQNEPAPGAESNNIRAATAPTQITQVNFPDLVVADAAISGSNYTAQPVTVSWRTVNSGAAPASGTWVDRVHLSDDEFFDPNFDPAVGQANTTATLNVGEGVNRSVSFNLPETPGLYRFFVSSNAGGAIEESESGNNTATLSREVIAPDYAVTISTPVTNALAGTVVPMSGTANRLLAGEPVPDVDLDILIRVRGTERSARVRTDASGGFSYQFHPAPNEAGRYSIGARHPASQQADTQDQFTLHGMSASPAQIGTAALAGEPVVREFEVRNLGDAPLTGISYAVSETPPSMMLTVTAPTELAPLSSGVVRCEILCANESVLQSTPLVSLSSAEGASVAARFYHSVIPLTPNLVAEPTSLSANMVRGMRTPVYLALRNTGGAPTNALQVYLPNVPFLRLVTPSILAPLAPGGLAVVQVDLAPAADLQLGPYSGAINIGGIGAGVSVPFTFTAISTARGGLDVYATDEFTYFAEGSPRVAGASVVVRSALDGSTVGSGVTGTSGSFLIPDVQEGYYTVECSAGQHGSYRNTVLVGAGATTSVEAFLPRQTVQYRWTVTPTNTQERYEIQVHTTYETHVPAPVITIDPPTLDLRSITEQATPFVFTITNHGLIAAESVRLEAEEHARWHISPLVEDIGYLPPNTSVTIPVLVTDLEYASGGAGGLRDGSPSDCTRVFMHTEYVVHCGVSRNYTLPIIVWQNTDACNQASPIVPRPPPPPPPPSGTGSGGQYVQPGSGEGNATPPWWPFPAPSCSFCRLPDISFPTYTSSQQCNPCAVDCGLASLECALSYLNAPANCIYGLARNCSELSVAGIFSCLVDGILFSCIDIPYSNGIQCLCNMGKACSCCPGAPIPCGLGDIFNLFDPDEPRPDTWCGPNAYPADRRPYVETLRDLYQARLDWAMAQAWPFGDEDWVNHGEEESPVFQAWLENFASRIAAGSPAGEQVDTAERAALVATPRPQNISAQHVEEFVDRWNRTMAYNQEGIFNRGQLPAGRDPNFIALDEWRILLDRASTAVERVETMGFESLRDAVDQAVQDLRAFNDNDPAGVCARVGIRLDQEAVITRSAFRATLEIENAGTDSSLTGIDVDLIIRDEDDHDVTDRFGIYPPELSGINAVDGSGELAANSSGAASWLIVPGDSAAPTEITTYFVSGVFRYSLGGANAEIPLFPTAIYVVPNASLSLKYFLESTVYSDDPFTPQTEPAVPFSLGLLMTNSGHGAAYDVRLTSAQPCIVDNDRDLLIDFQLVGTQVGAGSVSPSLSVALGDLAPGATALARWLFTASLQGEFTEYSATFRHVNGLGRDDLSLIENVEIHGMTHAVRALLPADDLLPDFLADDIPDANGLPDTLHSSDGLIRPVAATTTGLFDGAASQADPVVELTVAIGSGFNYLRLDDPSFGELPLIGVAREDGRALLRGANFWQTRRVVRREGQDPYEEVLMHLFDDGGPGRYTLTFAAETNPCPGGVGDAGDTDGDGVPNCVDLCPFDPSKAEPGSCGCGFADTDSDGDGTPDCDDACPGDPAKTDPGACGCGTLDADTDQDGTPDCRDGCPMSPAKTSPGVCGCAAPDADSDGDGVLDCLDGCPADPLKIAPGYCGCNSAEDDRDGDTIPDCADNCPDTANIGQLDSDQDGFGNACDCPCDVTEDGGLDSQDYFTFIDNFLSGNADINARDGTDSQDFFDFFDCFAIGCR